MRSPIHRMEGRKVLLGMVTVAVLAAVGIVGGIVQRGGPVPGMTYTYVSAEFADVGILKPGKEVKQNGSRIGQVSAIDYTAAGTARVEMRLEGDYDVHSDATAAIGNVSALGKKFVALDLGSDDADVLESEDVIPLAQTQRSQSLEDILADLDDPTLKSLNRTLEELATGIATHSGDLNDVLRKSPDLLADLETVAASASSPRSDLAGLLVSADTLVSRFEGREAEIRSLLDNADQTVRALGVDEARPLEQAVSALPRTLDTTKKALDDLHPPLADAESAVQTLLPGGKALGQSTPTLRKVLREAPTPLDKVPSVSEQAQPAVDDLTATVSDARPLVPRVERTVGSLAELLVPFAPYAGDAGRFFSQHDLLSGTLQGTDDKHYFAALLTAPGLFSVAGVPDPLYRSEAYPKPGTAWNHRTVTDNRGGGQ